MSPQIMCASALPSKTGKHENCIFALKCCISALPEFNPSFLDLFNLFDSRLILKLLYDSLNLVINAFSSTLLVHGLTERKSRELQQLDCVPRIMHVYQRAVLMQEKNFICNVFDSV